MQIRFITLPNQSNYLVQIKKYGIWWDVWYEAKSPFKFTEWFIFQPLLFELSQADWVTEFLSKKKFKLKSGFQTYRFLKSVNDAI